MPLAELVRAAAKLFVSEAYKDVVARFLGEERPMRFVDAAKQGFFKRLFGGR